MLHEPRTLQALCKCQSTDFRYAALKCASRRDKLPPSCSNEDGSTKILLRRTNSKVLREYTGNVITLDTPQQVVRDGRTITYTKKPQVKFMKSWTWDDALHDLKEDDAEQVPTL